MKILFLGDSITQGVGASELKNCYVSLVKEKLGCEVINYGISGTRIARQFIVSNAAPHDWDFQQRAFIMDKDADLVFVFGGTNDYGHGNAPIGEPTSHDPYSFCGGLNNLVEYLLETYGKEKLCFLLPLRRSDENKNGKHLIDYVECMRNILTEKGVSYIDFYKDGLSQPLTEKDEGYFRDGLHPNDQGHEWVADRICKYVRNF